MDTAQPDVDAIVIGAGFSGLYATWRLSRMGLSVRAFDLGEDIGGVWAWNRYPGAQTDSPHHTYRFTFDPEDRTDWRYSMKYPPGTEVLAYLNQIADKHDLRKYYTLSTRVTSARYLEDAGQWEISTDGGETVRARYFVTGVGLVSEPVVPTYQGLDTFGGQIYYTSRWPHDEVDIRGKRVALIGTGSSGCQITPWLVDNASDVTVFVRTPNYVAPTGNRPVTDEDQALLGDGYDAIKDLIRKHPAAFPFELSQGRLAVEATPHERQAVFEQMWERGGFSLLYESFDDIATDPAANEMLCEFFRSKIREIVKDPERAQILSPTYPYGAKRPPTGDGFLKAFNEPHVGLVDLRATPITEITERGIRTGETEREFDVIVLATGFDASTGAFTRMNITGRDGLALNDHWSHGPRTYGGVAIHGFPNLFMVAGPQSPFSNLPPGAEAVGGWIADLIEHMRDHHISTMETTAEAESAWVELCESIAAGSFALQAAADANSWFAGTNVEGKAKAFNIFFGGSADYLDRLDAEAASGYDSFDPRHEGVPVDSQVPEARQAEYGIA